MAKIQNIWIGYVHRTYQQMKDNVLTKMGSRLPEITDHTESNPFVKFLSIWTGIAEHLNYYIDNSARELFLPTARQYVSAVKIASMFGYRVSGVKAATVDLTFSLSQAINTDYFIPIHTKTSTEDGIPFITLTSAVIPAGETSVIVNAKQVTLFEDEVVGVSDGTPNQFFPLTESTEDSSVNVEVGNTTYSGVDSLYLASALDNVYTVGLNPDQVLQIRFGNGVQGSIPPNGQNIVVSYSESLGAGGNLAENTIINIDSNLPTTSATVSVTNVARSSGGVDIQSLASLKENIPLYLRTQRRAVTTQDYRDIAKLVSGVAASDIIFKCGKTVDVYIVPEGGGIASQSLIDSVKDAYYDETKMVTTEVRVFSISKSKQFE